MDHEIIGIDKDKLNPRGFGGMCSRETVTLRAENNEEINFDKGISAVATTEAPAIVVDWERWQMVREILPMRYCDLTGDDSDPLLDAHSRISIEKVKGSGREWKIEGPELICSLFISESEIAIRQKIKEKHIRRVSLGYMTDSRQTVEVPRNAEVIIDGVTYKNEFEDDYPLLVRTWWKKQEISLVPLGADEAAKFRAAMEKGIKTNDPDLQKKLDDILKNQKALEDKINISIKSKGENHVDEPTTKTPEQIKAETVQSILEYGKKNFKGEYKAFSIEKAADVMQGKEYSYNDFLLDVTSEIQKKGGAVETPATFLDLTEKQLKSFSSVRAAQNIINGKREGIEFEANTELEKRTGIKSGPKEILMPADIQNAGLRNMYPEFSKRAHTIGTPAEGGYFVTPDFQADLLKQVLRFDTVLGRLGCTVITGLRGEFQMPKIVSGLTTYNAAENTAGTTSYITVGLETVNQKRWTANTEYGRQAFMSMDANLPGFDQLLIGELYDSLNTKVDYDGINGTGVGNNPTGILNQSGPAAATLTSVNWKSLVNFKRLIRKAKGSKEGLRWLNSIDVEAVLDITQKVTGQAIMLRSEEGKINGFMGESSGQVPDQVSILGFWPEFYILNWGVEKLVVADQPQHKADMIELSLHRYGNFFLRSSESFAIADDATVDVWNG